jgi:site-specific recombinase XerD
MIGRKYTEKSINKKTLPAKDINVQRFLDEIKVTYSENTYYDYNVYLSYFTAYLESINKNVLTANKGDITAYLSQCLQKKTQYGRPMAKSTLKTYLACIKSLYRYLTENEYIEKNPTLLIKNIRADQKDPVFLTDKEIAALMSVCYKPADQLFIALLLSTGVRSNEFKHICRKDIAFDTIINGTVEVKVFGKGHKERPVLMDIKTAALIDDLTKDLSPDTPIYPYSVKYMAIRLTILGKQAGINKKLSPHKLRHTFATQLIKKSGNSEAARILLGHTTATMTTKYSHLILDDIKGVYGNSMNKNTASEFKPVYKKPDYLTAQREAV